MIQYMTEILAQDRFGLAGSTYPITRPQRALYRIWYLSHALPQLTRNDHTNDLRGLKET